MIGQYCGPVCGAPLDWVPMSVVAESDGLDFDSNPFVYGISGNIRGVSGIGFYPSNWKTYFHPTFPWGLEYSDMVPSAIRGGQLLDKLHFSPYLALTVLVFFLIMPLDCQILLNVHHFPTTRCPFQRCKTPRWMTSGVHVYE